MSEIHVPPARMRTFLQLLVNTAAANVTTSFLWFALTFWVYLETRSVLATGIIGGAYMLLVAVFSILFGTIVDRHRKHRVMVVSAVVTLIAFSVAGGVYLAFPESALVDVAHPAFWLFAGVILLGSVVENMRNIALSTTVTLLVPEARRPNANGLVGTVQGIAFITTSVFSGLSVGLLGMGATLLIALAFTAAALVHLLTLRVPEEAPRTAEGRPPAVDLRGSIAAIRQVPGLFTLILFTTFNNLIGGVYLALMDPYGLELFPVEVWGVVLGVTATGFIIGGALVAKFGLGRNPVRTMLLVVMLMGLLGAAFTIREWWWLYVVGIWAYMICFPIVEAAEQTIIQKVVRFERQGRIFGLAQALESAASPITAFLIAPLAQFVVIPYLATDGGRASWSWLLGDGQTRGIALVFVVAGLVMVVVAAAALLTRPYRTLSGVMADGSDDGGPTSSGSGLQAASTA